MVIFDNYSSNFSYDVIANEAPETVLEKFKKSNARLIFSAEETCWPDMSLAVRKSFFIFVDL